MLYQKLIALIIPFYNEAKNISDVISSIPDFVDIVILVNDGSTDDSIKISQESIEKRENGKAIIFEDTALELQNKLSAVKIEKENKYYLIVHHLQNLGKGAGIKTGYKLAESLQVDCIATMDGDGQMNPDELIHLCMPIVKNQADYTKGNRLAHVEYKKIIPFVRLMGIYILATLTRWSSGYRFIQDAQSGYTAISLTQLEKIDIDHIYDKYGYVNDILIRLSVTNCRVVEVPVTPIYRDDRKSKMNVLSTTPKICLLMIRMFFWKLWYQR